jgi:crotonobetainyl-CoA:carnitine CoA-transferase CaiB-like acyl-CoA transferase
VTPGTRPFANVRVLDFTQVLAGPYGSYQLALLGADVIKVERRDGEDMRRTPLSREWAERGMAPSWLAINGNKRSLTLDLQKPAAIDVVNRLAAHADVVMENFRPGVMDRLGIGYQALRAINPKLIYCTISGFGTTGPYRNEAGYDGKMQALSGIMSLTGHKEMGPTRAGFAVCDVLSGMTAAFAIASALFQRTHTGRGSSSTCRCWRRASPSCPPRLRTSLSPATGRSSSATRRSAARSRRTCSVPMKAGCCWR